MNKEQPFKIIIIIIFILLAIIVILFNSSTNETNLETIDRLQQERFKYEAKQQEVDDYLKQREIINKYKSQLE